jgi:hypothetical protein
MKKKFTQVKGFEPEPKEEDEYRNKKYKDKFDPKTYEEQIKKKMVNTEELFYQFWLEKVKKYRKGKSSNNPEELLDFGNDEALSVFIRHYFSLIHQRKMEKRRVKSLELKEKEEVKAKYQSKRPRERLDKYKDRLKAGKVFIFVKI